MTTHRQSLPQYLSSSPSPRPASSHLSPSRIKTLETSSSQTEYAYVTIPHTLSDLLKPTIEGSVDSHQFLALCLQLALQDQLELS